MKCVISSNFFDNYSITAKLTFGKIYEIIFVIYINVDTLGVTIMARNPINKVFKAFEKV